MSHSSRWIPSGLAGAALALLATVATASEWIPGDVFVAVGEGSYRVYGNDGEEKETIDSGLSGITAGCEYDWALERLYGTAFSETKVFAHEAAHPHDVSQVIDTGRVSPGGGSESVAIARNGDVFVGHVKGNRLIHRYDATGELRQTYEVATDGSGPDWVELSADQRTLFYTTEGNRIFRYDTTGAGRQLPDFAEVSGELSALRLLPPGDGSGGLLVVAATAIHRLDPAGRVVQTYDAPGEDSWFSLTLDPDGTSFWTGTLGSRRLYRFDVASGGRLLDPVDVGVPVHGLCTFHPRNRIRPGEDALAVRPGRGGDTGFVTTRVVGGGFSAQSLPVLRRAGETDIVADRVVLSEDRSGLFARFDLRGRALGLWDLVETISGETTRVVSEAFEIEPGRPPEVYPQLIGRTVIRPNQIQTYVLTYANNGNVDAEAFSIGMSGDEDVTLWFANEELTGTSYVSDEGEPVVVVDPPTLAPGESVSEAVFVQARRTTGFSLHVWANPFPFLSPPTPAAIDAGSRALSHSSSMTVACDEAGVREQLTDAVPGITFNNNGCPTKCQASCPDKDLRDSDCKTGCTDVCGLREETIDRLIDFATLATEQGCDFQITGGSECDSHSNGPCSHDRGSKVDVALNDCLVGLIENGIGLKKTYDAGTPRKNGYPRYYDTDTGDEYTIETFDNPNRDHLDITFFSDGDKASCGDPPRDPPPLPVSVIASSDPNDKTGPLGAGLERFVLPSQTLAYLVQFENVPSATAAAQRVIVEDVLDPDLVDLDTFSLGPITVADRVIQPPPLLSRFRTDADLRPAMPIILQVDAGLDASTGLVRWEFTSLDPETRAPVEDPLLGFLPPNRQSPEGQGSVAFTVRMKAGLSSGDAISNLAAIVFDDNEVIVTPAWRNTIDADPPVSAVGLLVPVQAMRSFTVSWSGEDDDAGVAGYSVFVSVDDGPFQTWLTNVRATSATFVGESGRRYAFYSTARDRVGNVEEPPVVPDTQTVAAGVVDVEPSVDVRSENGRTVVEAGLRVSGPQGDESVSRRIEVGGD